MGVLLVFAVFLEISCFSKSELSNWAGLPQFDICPAYTTSSYFAASY
jgi:hypothetical protein